MQETNAEDGALNMQFIHSQEDGQDEFKVGQLNISAADPQVVHEVDHVVVQDEPVIEQNVQVMQTTEQAIVQAAEKPKRARSSTAWYQKYFDRVSLPGKIICLECINTNAKNKKVYQQSTGGTTLRRHLFVDHGIQSENERDPTQVVLSNASEQLLHSQPGAGQPSGVAVQEGTSIEIPAQDQKEISDIARQLTPRYDVSKVALLDATIGDLAPGVHAYLLNRIHQLGATDVWLSQVVQGTKSLPCTTMHITCQPGIISRLMDEMNKQSNTVCVRVTMLDHIAPYRQYQHINTQWGTVSMCVSVLDGRPIGAVPDYDQCVAIAEHNSIPLKDVMECSKEAWRQSCSEDAMESEGLQQQEQAV